MLSNQKKGLKQNFSVSKTNNENRGQLTRDRFSRIWRWGPIMW